MQKKIFLVIILLASVSGFGQREDKRIAEIRESYNRTNQKIVEAEKNFPESNIFLTELVVNSGGTMYPAVGNFKETVRFYYTYGNREISPYPNRILKIVVSTERSSVRESAEYFFDALEQMNFALENDSESKDRFYFSAGKMIRWQKGEKIAPAGSRKAFAAAKAVVIQKERLLKIFRASLQ